MRSVRTVVVAMVAVFLCGAGAAAAQACTDSWKGAVSGSWGDGANWSTGKSPESADDACITVPGTYTVTLGPYVPQESNARVQGGDTVNSLTLGGSSGTQTLDVAGQSYVDSNNEMANLIGLTMTAASSVGPSGHVILDATSGGSAPRSSSERAGGSASFDVKSSLTNAGQITSQVEDSDWQTYTGGAITNTGQVDLVSGSLSLPAPDQGGSGSQNSAINLTNNGTVAVAAGAKLFLDEPGSGGTPGTFTNNGTITDSGTIIGQSNGGGLTWNQLGGSIAGNPVHLQNGALLNDTAGAGSFLYDYANGGLEGTIPAGQTVTLQGSSWVTSMNETANDDGVDLQGKTLVNDGTLVLNASANGPTNYTPVGANADLNNGTVENAGVLATEVTDPSWQVNINAGLINEHGGTVAAESGKSFLTNGQTVTNHGTIAIAPGATLDEFANQFTSGVENFTLAADGTVVPQIASASSYGQLVFDADSNVTLGGTVAPQLVGAYRPTTNQELQAFPLQGRPSPKLTGAFAAVTGGFHADYGQESASSPFVGLVYSPGATTTTTGKKPATGVRPSVGSLKSSGETVVVKLSCPKSAGSCAKTSITASIVEKLSGRRILAVSARKAKQPKTTKKTIAIAGASTTVKPGKSVTLTLKLNRAGRVLIARYHRLSTSVSVVAARHTIKRATVRLSVPKQNKRGHK